MTSFILTITINENFIKPLMTLHFLVQIKQLPTQFFPLNLLHRPMCEAISPPTDSFLASPVLSQNDVLSQVTNHWKWPPLHSHKVDLQLGPSEYTSGKANFQK